MAGYFVFGSLGPDHSVSVFSFSEWQTLQIKTIKAVTKKNMRAKEHVRLGFHLYLRPNNPRPKSPRPKEPLSTYDKKM